LGALFASRRTGLMKKGAGKKKQKIVGGNPALEPQRRGEGFFFLKRPFLKNFTTPAPQKKGKKRGSGNPKTPNGLGSPFSFLKQSPPKRGGVKTPPKIGRVGGLEAFL